MRKILQRRSRLAGLTFLVISSFGCNQAPSQNNPGKDIKADRPVSQLPTATEVFHLRGECAKCGEQIMAGSPTGSNLTQGETAHYDPESNRCYVQSIVQSADLSGKYYATYLYDGQTKELLAYSINENGQRRSAVFHKPLTAPTEEDKFQQAQDYMNAKIEDTDYSK